MCGLFRRLNCCTCVIMRTCWGSECKNGALIIEVIGAGVALGIGVGMALSSHFLRK